jgi:hypothetical protein
MTTARQTTSLKRNKLNPKKSQFVRAQMLIKHQNNWSIGFNSLGQLMVITLFRFHLARLLFAKIFGYIFSSTGHNPIKVI